MNLARMQRLVPARVKFLLKPYYRKIFRKRLHAVLWPTFRCNYSCSYCTVHTRFDFTTLFPRKSERSVEQWLEGLEKLPPAMIYVAGGEPLLYPGFSELVNKLPAKHQLLGIVSNISLPAATYGKIQRTCHLNASFHREFVDSDAFVARVKELQRSFRVHVNIVATPENLPVLASLGRLMKKHGITLHIDPYVDHEFCYDQQQLAILRKYTQADRTHLVGFDDFARKQCSAGRNYINILPNGDAFACAAGFNYALSPLYAGLVGNSPVDHYRLGNLFESDFRLNSGDMVCQLPCKDACDRDAVVVKPCPA